MIHLNKLADKSRFEEAILRPPPEYMRDHLLVALEGIRRSDEPILRVAGIAAQRVVQAVVFRGDDLHYTKEAIMKDVFERLSPKDRDEAERVAADIMEIVNRTCFFKFGSIASADVFFEQYSRKDQQKE
ncbi:MAG: hypothetical protein Q7S61_00450 [bacterium]|nr:hypothetical protein [bacterium]